jgi:hypothetical protein
MVLQPIGSDTTSVGIIVGASVGRTGVDTEMFCGTSFSLLLTNGFSEDSGCEQADNINVQASNKSGYLRNLLLRDME